MYGFGSRALGRFEQPVDDEVALRRGRPAERVRLVCVGDMARGPVRIGVHSDGADAQLAQRAKDAERNLAPVRNEDFGEHTPYSLDR